MGYNPFCSRIIVLGEPTLSMIFIIQLFFLQKTLLTKYTLNIMLVGIREIVIKRFSRVERLETSLRNFRRIRIQMNKGSNTTSKRL